MHGRVLTQAIREADVIFHDMRLTIGCRHDDSLGEGYVAWADASLMPG